MCRRYGRRNLCPQTTYGRKIEFRQQCHRTNKEQLQENSGLRKPMDELCSGASESQGQT